MGSVAVEFLTRFAGRTDIFAEQQDDGSYKPHRRQINPVDVGEHLAGRRSYGIYTVRADNTTKLMVFDVDTGKWKDVAALLDTLETYGLDEDQVYVEWSGRKGWHLWLFLEDWTDAGIVYRAGRAILQQAGMEGTEVYPKQEAVDPTKPYGNLIKLPLGKHRQGDWSKTQSTFTEWDRVQLVPKRWVMDMAGIYKAPEHVEASDSAHAGFVKLLPCITRITTQGVGHGMRDYALYTLALDCKRRGLSEDEARETCEAANDLFKPPMSKFDVWAKARSAYSSHLDGFSCSQPFLHQPANLLCSKLCPRYPAIKGMPATDDAPEGSAGSGGAMFLPGRPMTLHIREVERRGDGKLKVYLDHPLATETVLVVIDQRRGTDG